MEAVVVEGQVEWREVSGSGDVSQCGCRAGAWVDDQGHCHECGQGIICKGMGVMEVLPGYFASPSRGDFVWQCHGEDWKRCPGGDPGTCAEHRINTSIACDECEPFTRMTNDGPCEQCTGPDIGLLVAVLVVVVAFLWCVYWVSAKENRRERKNVFTLAAIVGSQFVTLFQMVGALASLSVAWPEPFARIVKLGSLVNFRLEVLNLGCVVATRPLQRYTATALNCYNVDSVHGLVPFPVLAVLPLRAMSPRPAEAVQPGASKRGRHRVVGCVHLRVLWPRPALRMQTSPQWAEHHARLRANCLLELEVFPRPRSHGDGQRHHDLCPLWISILVSVGSLLFATSFD